MEAVFFIFLRGPAEIWAMKTSALARVSFRASLVDFIVS